MSPIEQEIERRHAELAALKDKFERLKEGAAMVPSSLHHEYLAQMAGLEQLLDRTEAKLEEAIRKGEPLPSSESHGKRPYEDLELAIETALARFGAPD
jgi:hypothetical protein